MQQQGEGYVNLSVKLLTRGARCCCFPNLLVHPGKLILYRNIGTELREKEEEKKRKGGSRKRAGCEGGKRNVRDGKK